MEELILPIHVIQYCLVHVFPVTPCNKNQMPGSCLIKLAQFMDEVRGTQFEVCVGIKMLEVIQLFRWGQWVIFVMRTGDRN